MPISVVLISRPTPRLPHMDVMGGVSGVPRTGVYKYHHVVIVTRIGISRPSASGGESEEEKKQSVIIYIPTLKPWRWTTIQ